LPSFGGTVPCPKVRSLGRSDTTAQGQEMGVRLPWAATPTETTGAPTFPGDPDSYMLRSQTPVGPDHARPTARPAAADAAAFRFRNHVGSHSMPADGAPSRSL